MADSPPLAGLLDRADKVFSLAGKLGRAFHEEHQGQGRLIDPTAWNRHALDFDEFCASLLDLRDAMQNPPDGFAPVAERLLQAAKLAKGIRDTLARDGGFTAYLDFFPDLNTVWQAGHEAVKGVTKAQRLDDLFAFVDAPAASNPLGIDTTPATPKPPIQLIEAAARDIPSIMANVPPRYDGAIELVASHLAKRLQDGGHTLAAAQWAVHESVGAERLQPGLIEVDLPSVGRVVGGSMRHWGGPDDRRMEWSGGGKGTVGIPKDKPAPFDSFKVTATELLWTWWRSSAVDNTNSQTTVGDLEDAIGRNASPEEIDSRFGDAWIRIHAAVRNLFRGSSTRYQTVFQELRGWLVSNYRPNSRTLTGAELRDLSLDNVAELLDSAARQEPPIGPVGSQFPPACYRLLELLDTPGALPLAIAELPQGLWPDATRVCIAKGLARQLLVDNYDAVRNGAGIIASHAYRGVECLRITPNGKVALSEYRLESAGPPTADDSSPRTKTKRSTERGEGRERLIAALTKHHKYADGGCLNLEPIGNNELARLAGVDQATASAFFKQKFKGHGKYKTMCVDAAGLATALKLLNGEFAPHLLYGSKPANEDERDEE